MTFFTRGERVPDNSQDLGDQKVPARGRHLDVIQPCGGEVEENEEESKIMIVKQQGTLTFSRRIRKVPAQDDDHQQSSQSILYLHFPKNRSI